MYDNRIKANYIKNDDTYNIDVWKNKLVKYDYNLHDK